MMNIPAFLLLCTLLPAAAQQAAASPAVTNMVFEGWGTFRLPVPAAYAMNGQQTEADYIFRVVPQHEKKAAMEIISTLTPRPLENGESVVCSIGGKKVSGLYVAKSDDGTEGTTYFQIKRGAEDALLYITVPDGPHREQMLSLLDKLQAEEEKKPETTPLPSLTEAETQNLPCWGTLTLPVPQGVRIVPQSATEAYLYHVYGAESKPAMTLYSGYEPETTANGKACTAEIAGETVKGLRSAGRRDFLLERGTKGAVLHIVVYDGRDRELMLAMLKNMKIQAPPTLSDTAKEQARYVFGEMNRLTAEVNKLFRGVHSLSSAEAAVPRMQQLLEELQAQESAMEKLSQSYGRAIPAFVGTLTPHSVRENSRDAEIQRVHDADCYGSAALQSLLETFMGL